MAGYSGTPLVKKLGIKPDMRVALVGAPEQFERLLIDLPASTKLLRGGTAAVDLVLWWPASQKDAAARFAAIVQRIAPGGGIWVAWAKKASGIATDLNEDVIRGAGLAQGWVDYKVCAISEIWSGLKFARRKS